MRRNFKSDKVESTIAQSGRHDSKVVMQTKTQQNLENTCRVSKRQIKAKRKIDFVYDGDLTEATIKPNNKHNCETKNNNSVVDLSHTNSKALNEKMKKVKVARKSPKTKGLLQKKCNQPIFDDIQVTVNSDVEDLDYVNDVLDHDDKDDRGSINEEPTVETVVSPIRLGVNLKGDGLIDVGLALGASSTSVTEEDMIMNNPHLRKLLNKMLDERINSAKSKGESSNSELLTRMTPQIEKKRRRQFSRRFATEKKAGGIS